MNNLIKKFLTLSFFLMISPGLLAQTSYTSVNIKLKPTMYNFYDGSMGRYLFSNGGCLEVEAFAEGNVYMEDVRWEMDGIEGFFYRTIPASKKGGNIIFKFMDLPEKNSDFGSKKISLYSSDGRLLSTKIVQLFYPRDAEVKMHKGMVVPNWFYYWGDILGRDDLYYGGSCYTGLPKYLGISPYKEEVFGITDWYSLKTYIFKEVVDAQSIVGLKPDPGIDSFCQAVLHEKRHVFQFSMWDTDGDGLPNDEYYETYKYLKDKDEDWLLDIWEDAQGYSSDLYDTVPNDNYPNDHEFDASLAEYEWPNNSHNELDWAYPGKQWPQEEKIKF